MYKIIVGSLKKATERSLPYEFQHEEIAEEICNRLNEIFDTSVYIHRVEPFEPVLRKVEHRMGRKTKGKHG